MDTQDDLCLCCSDATTSSFLALMHNYHIQLSNHFKWGKLTHAHKNNLIIMFAQNFTAFSGVPDREHFQPNLTTFRDDFVPNGLTLMFRTLADVPDIVKQVVAHEYTDWNDRSNLDLIRRKSVQLLSDMVYTSPTLQSVTGHASSAQESKNTYMYVFSVIPSRHTLYVPSWFDNATHGDEFSYEFFEEGGGTMSLLPGFEDYEPEDWERGMAKYVMTLWSNFAKTG